MKLLLILGELLIIIIVCWGLIEHVLPSLYKGFKAVLKDFTTHEGETYYCINCERSFNNNDSIKTKMNGYPCPSCGSINTCKDTLKTTKK